MIDTKDDFALSRVPTGIPGLDTILGGGFLQGGVYIVQGTPGAGKTIFANQFCFRHVQEGGRAAFVTLLAESHTRMLQHLQPMDFYDQEAIPSRLYYVSGFNALENEGLKGFLDLLRREIRGHKATAVVIDGFLAVEEAAPAARDLKKFVHEVQSYATAANCTVLLLTNGSNRAVCPEHTMVDGLIELDNQLFTFRTERSLIVRKFRGSGFLSGRHSYEISNQGVAVFPRIEEALATPSRTDAPPSTNYSTGAPGLDAMMGGGIPAATTTAVVGPSGVGKTTLGLQFVSRSSAAEPGLIFSFYETPERLRDKAALLGIDLKGMEARGDVEIVWQAQAEHMLDQLAYRLLEAVERRKVKRLLVDGLSAMTSAAIHPERISRFFAVLANELRAQGVTTLYTAETREIWGSPAAFPVDGVSSLLENLLLLRYVELDSRVRRALSVVKMRDRAHDPFLREITITSRGMEIGAPFGAVDAVLTGKAHASDRTLAAGRKGEGQA
jgi:circadian clock protein KaiC